MPAGLHLSQAGPLRAEPQVAAAGGALAADGGVFRRGGGACGGVRCAQVPASHRRCLP